MRNYGRRLLNTKTAFLRNENSEKLLQRALQSISVLSISFLLMLLLCACGSTRPVPQMMNYEPSLWIDPSLPATYEVDGIMRWREFLQEQQILLPNETASLLITTR